MTSEPQLKINELIEFVMKNCVPKTPNVISSHSTESFLVESETIDTKKTKYFNTLFGKFSKDVKCLDVIENIQITENNISFCASFLTCILEDFQNLSKDDKTICISKFFAKILSEIKKRNGLNKYITPTLIWDKKELVSNLTDLKITNNIIAYITTYLNVNLFVVSYNEIVLYCMGKNFNIYKQNIILFKEDQNYKPLVVDDKKIWLYSDEIMTYFIQTHQNKINIYQQNKSVLPIEFKIGNDNDIELMWTNETETKSITEEEKKSVKITIKKENPETTEQILDAVLVKDTKKKNIIPQSEMKMDFEDCDSETISGNSSDDEKEDIQQEKPNQTIKYTKEALTKLKCTELKQLANDNKISLTMKVNGKTKQKLKQDLIDELSKC